MPTVVPTDSRPLSCPPIGALPRNRLASSATGSASPISPTARFAAPLVTPSVGADAHIGPPIGTSCYAFVVDGVPDDPFCCTSCNPLRRGRCLHRPARPCPALLVALTPPVICRTSCHPVIAKPVTDVTGCGNPPPVPSAPLPKGGWHGEAVTEGFSPARTYSKRAAVLPASIPPPTFGWSPSL